MSKSDRPHWGPFGLDGDERWRWGVWGRIVDGDLWPYRIEVRYKGRPCHHDERPADHDDANPHIEWEPRPCDCWEALGAPTLDEMSVGGLTVRALRRIQLGQVEEQMRRTFENAQSLAMPSHGPHAELLARTASEVVDRRRRPGPGRKPMPAEVHVRRLAAMSASGTQEAAARRLGITTATLRRSLEWAREEGLWTRKGRGVAGHLTPKGEEAVAALPRKGKRS